MQERLELRRDFGGICPTPLRCARRSTAVRSSVLLSRKAYEYLEEHVKVSPVEILAAKPSAFL